LDWDFLHCETVVILGPTEEQKEISRKLMEDAKTRAAREVAITVLKHLKRNKTLVKPDFWIRLFDQTTDDNA